MRKTTGQLNKVAALSAAQLSPNKLQPPPELYSGSSHAQRTSFRVRLGAMRRVASSLSQTPEKARMSTAIQCQIGNSRVMSLMGGPQAKVEVGKPDERYEQEADVVASRVVSGQKLARISRISGGLSAPAIRQPPEEEKALQGQTYDGTAEDEPIQASSIQCQAPEEEEELQSLTEEEPEEEKPIQTNPLQQQAPEEEELKKGTESRNSNGAYSVQCENCRQQESHRDTSQEDALIQGKHDLQAKTNTQSVGAVEDVSTETRLIAPGGGRPIPDGIHAEMESGLGADFSNVRVHDTSEDRAKAKSLEAKAVSTKSGIGVLSDTSSTANLRMQRAPVTRTSARSSRRTYMVLSPRAYLRTPPPGLKRRRNKLRKYSLVHITGTSIRYARRKRIVYVKVAEALSNGQFGPPLTYGWTAYSNLRLLGRPLRYRLSTSRRKGRTISFRKYANKVIRKVTGKAPSIWFNNFVYTSFLGRVTATPIHISLSSHLKKVERTLSAKYGGKHRSPYLAGNTLGLVTPPEIIKGARKSSTSSFFSMHFFGLAIDLDYSRNPHITDTKNDRAATAKVLPRAGLLIDGLKHRFVQQKLYVSEILKLDKVLEKYFSCLSNHAFLIRRLNYAKRHKISYWKNMSLSQALNRIRRDLTWVAGVWGRSRQIIKIGGFTNLRKELIKGIGLYWGGDFGDMMHFDMRNIGLGKKIDKERRK